MPEERFPKGIHQDIEICTNNCSNREKRATQSLWLDPVHRDEERAMPSCT
jgi:hypothetical protein